MYPSIDPYDTGYLDVGDGHKIYYEQCGNPAGKVAVYLHGGPGGGIHPDRRRFFNPEKYRVVLFDQRGCGRSEPLSDTKYISIRSLTDDIENLRLHLDIEKWSIVGGSWGSTLAMFNAVKYPDTVSEMILTGIFFGDPDGVEWLTEEGGASEIMPEWFAPYRDLIPEEKRGEGLAQAYSDIMKNGTKEEILEAVRRCIVWDTAILYFEIAHDRIEEVRRVPEKFLSLCGNFFHFVTQEYKNENKSAILSGIAALGEIPSDDSS